VKKIILSVMAACLFLGVSACKQNNTTEKFDEHSIATYHNSQNSLDWAGVYRGIIPAADTPGIKIEITLNWDGTFVAVYEYIGGDSITFKYSGRFTWDANGRTITLEDMDKSKFPVHYQVGEGVLFQLDLQGNRITGNLADKYIFKQEAWFTK